MVGAIIVAVTAPNLAFGVVADPQIVSLTTTGLNRIGVSVGSAVSADGRWIAFTSTDDLTGASAAGVPQIYVRDRAGGTTVLASANTNGIAAAAPGVDDPTDQRAYAISGDGHFVVFASQAANLVAGDPDGTDRDVFRKDLRTGAITTVSRAPDGSAANAPVGGDPDISFDGSRVVFESGFATNLWSGDVGLGSDIVVNDLVARTTRLASAAPSGGALTGTIRRAVISADGRVVAFEDDGAVIVRDVGAATTAVVAQTGTLPDLSGDGRVLVFQNGPAIMRHDRLGTASTVSADGAAPVVSADGNRVAFQETTVPIPGDANGVADVYARRLTDPVERVSERADGTAVSRLSDRPAISADGGTVAFALGDGSPSQSLSSGDTEGATDVLAATLPATDTVGPAMGVLSPADGLSVTTAAVGVSGVVADPSGVVSVTVNGFAAVLSPTNAFGVEIPLAVGVTPVTVRARDGAGHVSEQRLTVTRSLVQATPAGTKARARLIRVFRAGRTTRARFMLDDGASRVVMRLWRRVSRVGQAPIWAPANRAKAVTVGPGLRTAIVSRQPLKPGIYQVRVTVVSAGGAAVGVMRHVVARRAQRR